MTYEYHSHARAMTVSTRRPLRVALRMWMTPIRVLYIKIDRWTRYSLMRKLLLAILALAVLLVLYDLLRS